MRLPNLARWLRTRNAAIASRRAANAARTKGVVGIEDQTPDGECDCQWRHQRLWSDVISPPSVHHAFCPSLKQSHWAEDDCETDSTWGHRNPDDLMAVADEVAETLCRHRWDVDPDIDGVHTVQHLCVVAIPSHGYHECACGVWRMEIGAGL